MNGTTAPTLVVTGFLAFQDVTSNPSALLVESLRSDPGWEHEAGAEPRLHLLDTVYAGTREQIGELLAGEPTALILTGYSGLATGLKIETRATNLCSPAHADASGWMPPRSRDPVLENSNRAVDFAALADALDMAEIPAGLSRDAGEYVCNNAYWHALDLIAERGLSTRAVFVHLPAVRDMADRPPRGAGAMNLLTMRTGLALIARFLMDGTERL